MEALVHYYCFIFIILIQSFFIKKIGKKHFLFLIALELWFLSAFRGVSVGNDTGNYLKTFTYFNLIHTQAFGMVSHMEQGYLFLNRLVGFFSHQPQAILIATSFIIICTRFLTFARYSVYAGLTTLFFVIVQFGSTLNIVREETAFSIILLALPFIIKRKLIPFLILCFVATSIHTSAITGLLLYGLYPLPWEKKYIFSLGLGSVCILFFLAPLLDVFFSITHYKENYVGTRLLGENVKLGSIIGSMITFGILCFESWTYKLYKSKIDSMNLRLPPNFLLFMSLMACVFYVISIRGTIFSRIAFYFYFFASISIPLFIQAYSRKTRLLLVIVIYGFFITYQSVVFVFRPDWNHWLPYQFCF